MADHSERERLMDTCKHCGELIYWDDYFSEYTHKGTGDPQCIDPVSGAYLPTGAEKESV